MTSKTAQRLIELRGQASQAAIAKVAECSPAAVSNWENDLNPPPADAIARLALHWHVSADYLVGLTDFPSGLSPDQFIVDLDVFEDLPPGKEWSVKVPKRCRVVDLDERDRMRDDVARRVQAKKGRR